MTHEKVGQGTYGCVFKPSLPCEEDIDSYENKVSKLMYNIYANNELMLYNDLNNIEGLDKYAITQPIKCSPKDSNEVKSSIKQCYKGKNYNTENFSILIYEDGGKNLVQFLSIDNFRELKSQGQDLKEILINFLKSLTNLID